MAIESIIPGDIGIAVSNIFRNPVSQRAIVGQRTFTEGYKRAFSGAAVGEKKELPGMRAHLFPGAFSSKDPTNAAEMKAYRLAQILTQREAGALGPEPTPAVRPGAADKLKANPGLRDEYDKKYGPGASDKVLGPKR
jgi:hypothetical protein